MAINRHLGSYSFHGFLGLLLKYLYFKFSSFIIIFLLFDILFNFRHYPVNICLSSSSSSSSPLHVWKYFCSVTAKFVIFISKIQSCFLLVLHTTCFSFVSLLLPFSIKHLDFSITGGKYLLLSFLFFPGSI